MSPGIYQLGHVVVHQYINKESEWAKTGAATEGMVEPEDWRSRKMGAAGRWAQPEDGRSRKMGAAGRWAKSRETGLFFMLQCIHKDFEDIFVFEYFL
jgi:hypothetical protein